jgi:hypothetical protein
VRKKEAVILAIRLGIIARADAYARYLLSPEEFAAWETAFDQGGRQALSGKAAARQRMEKNSGSNIHELPGATLHPRR